MLIDRTRWSVPIFTFLLFCCLPASAQDLALTKESEFGFRRLIHAAQVGELGYDVTNANVFVLKNRVQVELVRTGGANIPLLLTRKASTHSGSRYFDIEPGEGATAGDAARVGKVLDQAFAEDPFEVAWDFLGIYSHEPIPTLAEAWRDGGRKGVQRVAESYLIAAAGTHYTLAVIIVVGIGWFAGLVLLWWSEPHHAGAPHPDRRPQWL